MLKMNGRIINGSFENNKTMHVTKSTITMLHELAINVAIAGIDTKDLFEKIGLVRVLWDYGYVVYIADVIVRPEFQGQGLGRVLMNNAMDFIKSQLKPGYKVMVSLMAAKGKEEFYKKFDFIERPSEKYGCGMCQWLEG